MSRQPLIPPCLRVLPAITLVLVLLLALGPLSNGLSPSRTALYGARKMPDSPESSRKFQELCVVCTVLVYAFVPRRYPRVHQSGLAQFKSGEFDACIDSLDTAAKMKTNQPLVQRGIILYCMGRYEEALAQLVSDTFLLEQARLCKASDLRLWQAACCNKLGQPENAIVALGTSFHYSYAAIMQTELTALIGQTCLASHLVLSRKTDMC